MDTACSTQTLTVRGLNCHLRLWGNRHARPVFLLHGLLDTGASFTPLVEAMQRDWRLIAPDWRGHGDSEEDPRGYWFPDYVADLEVLIKHYAGDTPARLVAHSMGATAASLFAGLRPTRVSHLVCLDGLGVPARSPARVAQGYRNWLDAQSQVPPPKTYPDVATLGARIRKHYPELKAHHIERLANEWSRPNPGGDIRLVNDPRHHVRSPYGFDPEHAMAVWRLATARVLCLDGGISPMGRWTGDEEMTRRRAAFRHLRHAVLPGCGHMLHLEQPGAVAAHVEPFLVE